MVQSIYTSFIKNHAFHIKNIRSITSSIPLYKKPKLKSSVNVDWVGPPDPDSNIRKIVYGRNIEGDKVLNNALEETYEWNNDFWRSHNKTFFEEKRKFIENSNTSGKGQQDVSDRLSVFYKDFLEKNHQVYMDYNREWYRRNFRLLWLSMRTFIDNLIYNRKEKKRKVH